MDETFRKDPFAYASFVGSLFKRNMVSFQNHCKSIITPFFCCEKGWAPSASRATNRLFLPSPDISLAAGYSFSQVEVPADQSLYIAQSDLKDYFCSLALPEDLRDLFCLLAVSRKLLMQAGIEEQRLPERGMLYGAFCVIPMGWSWVMWIAQRVHQHQAMIASGLSIDRIIFDGRPPPPLASGEPALLPYADNSNVIGTDPIRVQNTKKQYCRSLPKTGLWGA